MHKKIGQKIYHIMHKKWRQMRSHGAYSNTPLKPSLILPKYDLKIASYNVHKCVGTDKIFDPERIVRVIAELNTDILALQEADKRFGVRIGLLNLDYLKEKTGLVPIPLRPMAKNGHGWHGNALFFRHGKLRSMVQIGLPGIEPRGALIAEIDMASGPIRIIAAHFGLLHHSRSQQAKVIMAHLQKRPLMPTIMTGDLNEWRLGKKSSLMGLAPYFDVTINTIPSFPSRFPILALDRIFAFPENLIQAIECHATPLAKIASDHLPLTAKLNLKMANRLLNDESVH